MGISDILNTLRENDVTFNLILRGEFQCHLHLVLYQVLLTVRTVIPLCHQEMNILVYR